LAGVPVHSRVSISSASVRCMSGASRWRR
jgi:hypothetical protein